MNSTSTFHEHAQSNGIVFNAEIIKDGQLHRVHIEGDKKGKKNGWYIYHPGVIEVCIYGSWKGDFKAVWCNRHDSDMNTRDKYKLKTMMMETARTARLQRKKGHQQAAQKAAEIYRNASYDFNGYASTKYLLAKMIRKTSLIKTDGYNIIIPVMDASDHITSIQYIKPDGRKMFLPGGKVAGGYCPIDKDENQVGPIIVCEGFATGATINQETGIPVLVAFNCGNLYQIAKMAKDKYPGKTIIIAADDDFLTVINKGSENEVKNPGMTKALAAAKQLGIEVIKPDFSMSKYYTGERKDWCIDFNDMAKFYNETSEILTVGQYLVSQTSQIWSCRK